MQLRIVFFGSGTYSIPIIKILQKHGLQLVVTTEDKADINEKHATFAGWLKKEHIPFKTSKLMMENDIKKIKAVKADVAVLASYGVIIKPDVIDLFEKGIINIHPSLLPKYKGPTPIQATILNGEEKTGVTIHKLDEIVDHGPILATKEVKLNGKETMQDLKNLLFKLGAEMLDEIITKLESGEILEEKSQVENKKYTPKLLRESGHITLDKTPDKTTLDRMIRAYYPWPGVWFEAMLSGKKRRVKLLPNNQIQVEGSKVMKLKDFANGYQKEGQTLLSVLSLYDSSDKV